MFRRFGDSLRRFMAGRYGTDKLNMAMLVAAVALSLLNTVLSLFLRWNTVYLGVIYPLLHLAVIVLVGVDMFRMFSRNIYKRQQENKRFCQLLTRLRDRRNRYFRCPKCRQLVRVPRHRGKLSIRCPKCGEKFIRKT